jgi:hypothetical protein
LDTLWTVRTGALPWLPCPDGLAANPDAWGDSGQPLSGTCASAELPVGAKNGFHWRPVGCPELPLLQDQLLQDQLTDAKDHSLWP